MEGASPILEEGSRIEFCYIPSRIEGSDRRHKNCNVIRIELTSVYSIESGHRRRGMNQNVVDKYSVHGIHC